MQKSPKKKTPVKKQKQNNVSTTSISDVELDITRYGAAMPYDNITYTGGIDTITLDPSNYMTSSITIPTTVTSGGYTLTGSGTSPTWTTSSSYNYDTTVNITSNGITMKEGTDIKIGNKSLSEILEKLEERLNILHPNEELEGRWDELKELGKKYKELEKELLEKEKMWKILKEK